MRVIYISLFCILANAVSLFGNNIENHTNLSDSLFTVSTNLQADTILIDPFQDYYINSIVELESTTGNAYVLMMQVTDWDFPTAWNVSFCELYSNVHYQNCFDTLVNPLPLEAFDFLELAFPINSTNITQTETGTYTVKLYDVDDATCFEEVTFSITLDASNIPPPSTGFGVSQNISDETVISYSTPDNFSIYNNIDIWNNNSGIVQIGWEVIDQFVPTAWDIPFYSFDMPNTFFINQDVPATGSFSLNPGEGYTLQMITEIANHNGVPGTRSIEILLYDLNDSLNHNEVLTFNANVEFGEMPTGFEVFNTESIQYFNPIVPDESIHFHHEPFEILNLNMFTPLELGWKVITSERPTAWNMQDELIMMSTLDFYTQENPEIPLSGTFTLEAGDFALIEYFIHELANNNNIVADTATLEILIYDTQDSAATAQILRAVSILDLPNIGTGFQVLENYSGSVHYVSDPNESFFMYTSPLYVSNESEHLIEMGWKKWRCIKCKAEE